MLPNGLYKTNPHGMYALYSKDGGKSWRESASITNEKLKELHDVARTNQTEGDHRLSEPGDTQTE